MNKTELIEELKKYRELSYEEPELAHKLADNVLLKYINNENVTKHFDEIEKDY